MPRVVPLTLVLIVVTASPALAQRRGYRDMTVRTPYGTVFNPALSSEWRQAGGNPMAYQQLMMQKMAMARQQQYQALQKQQAAFNKWYSDQKAKRDKGQPTDPAFNQMTQSSTPGFAGNEAAPHKSKAELRAELRKKVDAKKAETARATRADPKPEPASKP